MTNPRVKRPGAPKADPPVTLAADGPPETGDGIDASSQENSRSGAHEEPFPKRAWEAVRSRVTGDVIEVIQSEVTSLTAKYGLADVCLLALYEPRDQIIPWYADRIVSALQSMNGQQQRDVVLLLRNQGGQIAPAYQIAKAAKHFAAKKFVVAIPRAAKSAATLLALGADEIHLGLLGELGPIDPQIGNLPALGVKRALETLATLSQETPGSSGMFADYLARTVRIDQIGYYERVAESAVQYAFRLLKTKPDLSARASEIANRLVYEYKDHGFVIDREEAQDLLGPLVHTNTALSRFAEEMHERLEELGLYLWLHRPRRRLQIVGGLHDGILVLDDDED